MVVVYANIIDVIGKRLYSGNIVWVREYVQNAFDANANNVTIRVLDNDIIIEDDGEGMGLQEINDQLFSLGGSVKSQDKIGQFGIGAYAGTGICSSINIRTRQKNGPIYILTLDMKKYNEIISKNKFALFDDVIKEIYSISKEIDKPGDSRSFTLVKFVDVLSETIVQVTKGDGDKLREVLEDYIPLELDDHFPHKREIEEFLEFDSDSEKNRNLKVSLEVNEKIIPIRKYVNKNFDFLPILVKKNIKVGDEKTIAKVWALYSSNGTSLAHNASFILRYKGVAVGGRHDVLTNYDVKDTKRYIGEIVIMNLDLDLNTQRSWFVESPVYLELEKRLKLVLNQLYSIASFDSKLGNGLIRKYKSLEKTRKNLKEEQSKGNTYNINLLNTKAERLELEIDKKIVELKEKISKLDPDTDETEKKYGLSMQIMKVLADRVFKEVPDKGLYLKVEDKQSKDKKWNSSAFVKSLLERYVVSPDFIEITNHKNSKDTLNNVFTLLETRLKEKLEFNVNLQKNADFWNLIKRFTDTYHLPPFVDPADTISYKDAFVRFITGAYGVFRNPSSHTFIEHYKDERYNIQFLVLGDILLGLIESWVKNE